MQRAPGTGKKLKSQAEEKKIDNMTKAGDTRIPVGTTKDERSKQ